MWTPIGGFGAASTPRGRDAADSRMAEHASSANGPCMIDRVQRPMFLGRLSLAAPDVLPKVAGRARSAERRPDGLIGTLREDKLCGRRNRGDSRPAPSYHGLLPASSALFSSNDGGPAMAGPPSH